MDYIRRLYNRSGKLTLNVLANLSGRLWSSALSILTIPVYIRLLGAEAFGLIGFFATFDVLFNILDFGLSTTINREIARNIASNANPARNKIILRTFEIIYWCIGACIAVIMLSSAGWVATHWVNFNSLTINDVHTSLIIISLAFFARWPISLYTGVLRGLQMQVLQNIILIITSTFRLVGGIIAISLISPTIQVYVLWYAIASGVEIILISVTAWNRINHLAPSALTFFDFETVKTTWKFAITFNLVGVIGMFVSSADRMVISKLLPLQQLGYYSIASTVAGIMPVISVALATAIFPRFVGVSLELKAGFLLESFNKVFGLLTYVMAGLGFIVFFYARELLILWTQAKDITSNAYYPLMFLALANMFNAISNIPYTLLIAQDRTRPLLIANIVSAIIYIPLLPFIISKFGLKGSASLLLLLNGILLAYFIFLVFKRIFFIGLLKYIYLRILLYLVLGFISIGIPRLLFLGRFSPIVMLLSGLVYFVIGFIIFKYYSPFPKGHDLQEPKC